MLYFQRNTKHRLKFTRSKQTVLYCQRNTKQRQKSTRSKQTVLNCHRNTKQRQKSTRSKQKTISLPQAAAHSVSLEWPVAEQSTKDNVVVSKTRDYKVKKITKRIIVMTGGRITQIKK